MVANIKDLPTLIGKSDSLDQTIDKVLRDPLSLDSIAGLSKHFKIRIKFSKPIEVRSARKYSKSYDAATSTTSFNPIRHIGTEHVFNGLFNFCGNLCYSVKRDGRGGYELPMEDILEYGPVLDTVAYFNTYQEFREMFDTLFITEAKIKELWDEKSGQHGSSYNKRDFKGLGPQGRKVLKRFLERFKSVTSTDSTGYKKTDHGLYLTETYDSWHHSGRDISISHLFGHDLVWYSSEFHRCGNGRYGLLANKSTYLWLEDD